MPRSSVPSLPLQPSAYPTCKFFVQTQGPPSPHFPPSISPCLCCPFLYDTVPLLGCCPLTQIQQSTLLVPLPLQHYCKALTGK